MIPRSCLREPHAEAGALGRWEPSQFLFCCYDKHHDRSNLKRTKGKIRSGKEGMTAGGQTKKLRERAYPSSTGSRRS